MWDHLAFKNKNPSPITKFVLAIFFTGIACAILGVSTLFQDSAGLVSPYWIFASYFLLAVGELLLSPVGLSAVTWLSPPQLAGIMMGVWFVALGFGGIFAGWIAKISSIPDNIVLTSQQKLAIYQNAFMDYAYLAFFVTAILFFVQLAMRKFTKHGNW